MEKLIQFLADMLGIPYDTVEGGVATLAFLLVAFLLRLLWASSQRDDKQVNLETTLSDLALTAVKSYQEMSGVMKGIATSLENMNVNFVNVVQELKNVVGDISTLTERDKHATSVREDIKQSLFKTSKTKIIVKDVDDVVIAQFTAEPDENGNLVVKFNTVEEEDTKGDVSTLEKRPG